MITNSPTNTNMNSGGRRKREATKNNNLTNSLKNTNLNTTGRRKIEVLLLRRRKKRTTHNHNLRNRDYKLADEHKRKKGGRRLFFSVS